MRVLYLPDKYDNYGAAISFRSMVLELKKIGIEPIIVAHQKGETYEFARNNGIQCHLIDFPSFLLSESDNKMKQTIKIIVIPVLRKFHKVRIYHSLKLIEREIDLSTIDLIHTNVNRNDIGAVIANKYKIPHIWHIREFGDLDYGCISLRNNYIDFMNKNTTAFVAISDAIKEHWIAKGLSRDKVFKIYNGVDCIKPGKKDNAKIRIIFAGLISKTKGQEQLIKAISLLGSEIIDNIEVDFFGSGEELYIDYLKKEVLKLNLIGTIRFHEYKKTLSSIIGQYDIGVVCSKAEAFGRVTAEYMMAGLCVVASNCGANSELISDGETGYLYEHNDIKQLSLILQNLINERSVIALVGSKAREKAISEFTVERNAKNIYLLYKNIIR